MVRKRSRKEQAAIHAKGKKRRKAKKWSPHRDYRVPKGAGSSDTSPFVPEF